MITFVDTSGIVALLSRADSHHGEAVATWRHLVAGRARLVTSDLVVAEATVVARARAGFEASLRVGEQLLAEPFDVVWVDRALMGEALRLYRRYADHLLSLCDCVSFAIMRRRRIEIAFTYDRDFDAMGFVRARAG
jgi:predicted nucleic acid-binding protein